MNRIDFMEDNHDKKENKKDIIKEKLNVIKQCRLECHDNYDNTHKFYVITLFNNSRVEYTYGRVGTQGRTIPDKYLLDTEDNASGKIAARGRYVEQKMEKINKGYVVLWEHNFKLK